MAQSQMDMYRILPDKPPAKALCLLACLLMLAACGQRGPLYLPDETAAAPAQQVQEQDENENDEETP